MGPNKVPYIIKFETASYCRDILCNSLKQSKCHVVSCDRSLKNITQNCEMDVLVRYFEPVDSKVKIHYLDFCLTGHSTRKNLLFHFTKTLGKLDANKMFYKYMDEPSINFQFLEKN